MSYASLYRWTFACAVIITQVGFTSIGFSQIVIEGQVLPVTNTVRPIHDAGPMPLRSPLESTGLIETSTPTKSTGDIRVEKLPNRVISDQEHPRPEKTDSARTNHPELDSLIEIEKRIRQMIPTVSRCVVALEAGTGVIISPDGYILTASHVAKKAGRAVEVRLPDGRTEMATTLGTNFNTDTAAVRLDSAGPWPFVDFGSSSVCQPGDWCLALGYPLSFPRGKPAAVRLGRILETSEDRLVTDCPIMGGDSGGPLFDLNGNLIGVSSRVKHDIAANLHIPIQTFQDEWEQLSASINVLKTSDPIKPRRAYLGVLGETDRKRVRIRRVQHGSPAAFAGWKAEDVLLQFDGQAVETFEEVLRILDDRKPGATIVAKLNRYGRLIDLPVRLGKQ